MALSGLFCAWLACQLLTHMIQNEHAVQKWAILRRYDRHFVVASFDSQTGMFFVEHQRLLQGVRAGSQADRYLSMAGKLLDGIRKGELVVGTESQGAARREPRQRREDVAAILDRTLSNGEIGRAVPFENAEGYPMVADPLRWLGTDQRLRVGDLASTHAECPEVLRLFGSSFLLAFLTLPVEFNASARAKELLVSHDIIQGDEQMAGVEKVLGAAAWTYVAAAVSAVGVWLFYVFMLLFRGRSEAAHR